MAKKTNLKKILKIIAGVIIFFTLPSFLFFGFLYFKYNQELPSGIQGEQADALAYKMLDALDYKKYKATDYIEFTFKKRHHYKWNKKENTCEVYWKNYKVYLDFNNTAKSEAFKGEQKVAAKDATSFIQKATSYFNNDTFWLVAPYKVLDPGTERRLVKTKDNKDALLITYTSGGSTPGDSYLWELDPSGKPTSFKLWTSILPIDGLEASWSNWTITKTGAMLPTFHKLLVLGIELEDISCL
ncbi:hypothetical protein KO494_13075 [Lacinutrix sp. C3R15]|uniref:hypothetical protein n=1 Tax=Flavobacteriaceae TaxID=49546 RepID=UPI001C0A0EA4|nr:MULTISPECIES: hypothetical protein [Flavobacteriaceae]MBU2940473.1 hypothetical protein [Lacinutrix sp. C3R15]MDO6623793.1 hypothetical protein [Oceanihabitans sp. 1_MG-2023]